MTADGFSGGRPFNAYTRSIASWLSGRQPSP
jgi:hypothetical protein